jgi:glycerophosphoryl diester phosphodiesterase
MPLVANVIESNRMAPRADIQSFDFSTLRDTYQDHPDLATVALWGDDPVFTGSSAAESGDGTSLQPQGSEAGTRWLAGLYWPTRTTRRGSRSATISCSTPSTAWRSSATTRRAT